ncbi:prephenate dehydrogenase [Microbispora amethystogenes]|uniref:Prephenate dehydrogenase n=1 Tax=Microbispora amethystogenes TaxID=1427754 RepID=A0ABQ4FPK8_9ACTN|nr:prephenate dehydrogenase [Microbispora amethystogenes]GIH36745.1 prephenate dehydrogenase [Microbispora amethystogenes]
MSPVETKVAPARVAVIGTGLIGTSIALALRGRGTEVLLADRDPAAVRLAADAGAGTPLYGRPHEPREPSEPLESFEPADLAILAVPPGAVPAALLEAQKRGVARVYTDVASVKERPMAEAVRLGCDMTTYVGGHPMGGRERSGPLAAQADLFLGRPWVLCPTRDTGEEAVGAATALILACGATPVVMDAADHDRAVALISHTPHVVSAAMAARFAGAPGGVLALTGQGARDVTRIAAGDPELWLAILCANARPIADLLEEVARDLVTAAAGLREGEAEGAVADLLARGVAGHGRIPGKHGGRPRRYTAVPVLVADRPGELALLFQAAGVAGINIEDVAIEHSPGRSVGLVELWVRPESAQDLARELRARGWSVPVGEAD